MNENNEKPKFPDSIVVVKIIDENRLAINRGLLDGIKLHLRFLIFRLSEEEIIDPETNKSLGKLEIVKGTGTVTHVQEKLATITSDMKSRPIRKTSRNMLFSSMTEEIVEDGNLLPFENPTVGDRAKPI